MKQEIGKALLVVFMEPEAGTEAEFNEWYNRYHVPERVSDRKSTRLNSSHKPISYAVFCLKKKTTTTDPPSRD